MERSGGEVGQCQDLSHLPTCQTWAFAHQRDGLKFHTHPVAKHDGDRGKGLQGHSWTQTQRKAKLMRRVARHCFYISQEFSALASSCSPLPSCPSLSTASQALWFQASLIPQSWIPGGGLKAGQKWDHLWRTIWPYLSRVISTLLFVKFYLSKSFPHQFFSGLFILGHSWLNVFLNHLNSAP